MPTAAPNDSRLAFRLPAALKQLIEQAAALEGQTVSDFAASTLSAAARSRIEAHDRMQITQRDRETFLALLDNPKAKPNKTLRKAARKQKRKKG